jgi:hypothetical protein
LKQLDHREDKIVKRVSEVISAALNKMAMILAGIHWDDIPDVDIGTGGWVCDKRAHRMINGILKRGK